MILSTKLYNNIFDILEEHSFIRSWHRDDFIEYFSNPISKTYYLDIGSFNNKDGRLFVSCHEEDLTDSLFSTIEKVNLLLQKLLESYLK